jgi:hypothetical protein
MIFAEMLTWRMDQQVPTAVLDERRRPVVQQEPTQVIEIPPSRGSIQGQGKIPAALGRAVAAQDLTRRKIASPGPWRPATSLRPMGQSIFHRALSLRMIGRQGKDASRQHQAISNFRCQIRWPDCHGKSIQFYLSGLANGTASQSARAAGRAGGALVTCTKLGIWKEE